MVLTKISIGYDNRLGKYIVKYHRCHYYLGLIKGYSYIDKEDMYNDLESAKYAIIQHQSNNKLIIDNDTRKSLSYTDALKLSGSIAVSKKIYKQDIDTDYDNE
tara:strand:- start:247 stop:555 length:309 start_codon:yes stop_codon:yes gene_type:complete